MRADTSLTSLTEQILGGAPLVKVLHPAELPELLGGRPWISGLLSTARSIAGLEAAPTARALALPPGRIAPDGALLLLELRLDPGTIARAIRIARERPNGALQLGISPLRRADGSPVGAYKGTGWGPAPWEAPELIAGAPLPIPAGARLIRRDRRDRVLAILQDKRWVPAKGLAPLEEAYMHALCGTLQPAPPPRSARDEEAPARFGFTLSDAYRAELLATLSPGTLFAAVEERLARFDWVQVAATEVCQTWQNSSGAFVEVWLQEGRITDVQTLEGDAAVRQDAGLGAWHRQGQPLVELSESVELSFVEGEAPGPVTALELAPDGWAWLMRSADGVERRWAGRVEPEVRARLFDALRSAGFPRTAARSAASRITLAADGRSQSAAVPDSGAYARLLAELRAVQQSIAGG